MVDEDENKPKLDPETFLSQRQNDVAEDLKKKSGVSQFFNNSFKMQNITRPGSKTAEDMDLPPGIPTRGTLFRKLIIWSWLIFTVLGFIFTWAFIYGVKYYIGNPSQESQPDTVVSAPAN